MAYDEKIRIGIDTREVIRGIDQLSKKLRGVENLGRINSRNFTQPLGKITGAANEFQKSMEAANARVLAFGAAAGTIYQVQRAFSELVKSTIEVEYSLAKINTLLKQTSGNLSKTSKGLFEVAKNTGQSFETVAVAMEEFARQGLSAEQALVRTRDAMILVRLTGMDTKSAVMSLTAAVNGFMKAGLDTTSVMNKMSKVASNFAVAERDLAEAVRRVGSSAVDAGVSFDELMAAVTSAQQVTARGGAVIGNSFKTIFTRLQRLRNIKALEEIGIQVRDMEGNIKPAMGVLRALAREFDNLKDVQRAQVAELIGGVFQVNVLKAVMSDLSKEHGIYNRAVRMSNQATDEAIQKNKALNVTIKALLNETVAAFQEMGAGIGKTVLDKPIKRVLNIIKFGLEKATPGEGQGIGTKLGKGILSGLGDFIAGPGLVMIAAVVGKLMAKFTKFAIDSLKGMTAVGKATQQRALMQAEIIGLLTKDVGLVSLIEKETIDVEKVQARILMLMNQQINAQKTLATVAARVAPGVLRGGVRPAAGGGVKSAGGAGGFVPKREAAAERSAAAAGGYRAGNVRSMTVPGFGRMVYNSAETVRQFPGFAQPAIMPPKSSSAGGAYAQNFRRSHGFNPYSSAFTPGFAKPKGPYNAAGLIDVGGNKAPAVTIAGGAGAVLTASGKPSWAGAGPISSVTKRKDGITSIMNNPIISKMLQGKHPKAKGAKLGNAYVRLAGIPVREAFDLSGKRGKPTASMNDEFKTLDSAMYKFAGNVNNQMFESGKRATSITGTMGLSQGKNDMKGVIFENAVRSAIGWQRTNNKTKWDSGGAVMGGNPNSFFDFNDKTFADTSLTTAMGLAGRAKVEAKIGPNAADASGIVKKFLSDSQVTPAVKLNSVVKQIEEQFLLKLGKGPLAKGQQTRGERLKALRASRGARAGLGFIPNFADANRMREAKQAGVSYGQTYYANVKTPNFSGTVVGNRRDEPTPGALRQAVMNHPNPATAGLAAGGHVPNFNPYDMSDERTRERLGHRDSLNRHGQALDRHSHTLNQGRTTATRLETTRGSGEGMNRGRRARITSVNPALSRGGGFAQSITGGATSLGQGAAKGAMGFHTMLSGNPMAGMGAMILAPMLAGAINEALSDSGQIGRGFGATAVGLGQAVSGASFGSMLSAAPGEKGATQGARSAAWQRITGSSVGKKVGAYGATKAAGSGIGAGIARGVGFGAARGGVGGAPGVLIGAAIGFAMEIPNIIQAFSDTGPEFTARMGEMVEKNENFIKSANMVIQIQGQLINSTDQMADSQKELLKDQLETAMGELSGDRMVDGKTVKGLRTQVREAYGRGDMAEAQALLGRGIMKAQGDLKAAQIASKTRNIHSEVGGETALLDRDVFNDEDWQKGKFDWWGVGMNDAGKSAAKEQARGIMGFMDENGKTLRSILKGDKGKQDKFKEVAKEFVKAQDVQFGKSQLDKANAKMGKFLKEMGISEKQRGEYMQQLREGASESNVLGQIVGLTGMQSDRAKLGEIYGAQGKEWSEILKDLDDDTAEKALTKYRKTLSDFQSHIFTMSESFRSAVADIEISSKQYIMQLTGVSKRMGTMEKAFGQMAGLRGAGASTMASIQAEAGINSVKRQTELKNEQAMQTLRVGLSTAIGGTMMSELARTSTQLAGGGAKTANLNPMESMKVSKAVGEKMIKLMADFETSFETGPEEFMTAIRTFKTALKGEQDELEAMQVEGKALDKEAHTELKINKQNLQKVNSELDKFEKAASLNATALQEEIKTRREALALQKNLINLQKKLSVGGGMTNVMNMAPAQMEASLNSMGRASRTGSEQQRGSALMSQLDLLQSFGAEIGPAARKQMTEYLNNHLTRLNQMMGMKVHSGSTRDTASAMVSNRYKTESAEATMVAKLNELTPKMADSAEAMKSTSTSLSSWLGGTKKPFVKIANLQELVAIMKSPSKPLGGKGGGPFDAGWTPGSAAWKMKMREAIAEKTKEVNDAQRLQDTSPDLDTRKKALAGKLKLAAELVELNKKLAEGPQTAIQKLGSSLLKPIPVRKTATADEEVKAKELALKEAEERKANAVGVTSQSAISAGLAVKKAKKELEEARLARVEEDRALAQKRNAGRENIRSLRDDKKPAPATRDDSGTLLDRMGLAVEEKYQTVVDVLNPIMGWITNYGRQSYDSPSEVISGISTTRAGKTAPERYSKESNEAFQNRMKFEFGKGGAAPKTPGGVPLPAEFNKSLYQDRQLSSELEGGATALAVAGVEGQQFNDMLDEYSDKVKAIRANGENLNKQQQAYSEASQKLAQDIQALVDKWQTLSIVMQKETTNLRTGQTGGVGDAFKNIIKGMTPEVKGNTMRDFAMNQAGSKIEQLSAAQFKKFGTEMEALIKELAKGTDEWPEIMRRLKEKVEEYNPWSTRDNWMSSMQQEFRGSKGAFKPGVTGITGGLGGTAKAVDNQTLKNYFKQVGGGAAFDQNKKSFQDMVIGETPGMLNRRMSTEDMAKFGAEMDATATQLKNGSIKWEDAVEKFRLAVEKLDFRDAETRFKQGSMTTADRMSMAMGKAMELDPKTNKLKYSMDELMSGKAGEVRGISGLMGASQNQADRRSIALNELKGSMGTMQKFRELGGIDKEVHDYKDNIVAASKLYEEGNITYAEFLDKIRGLNKNIDPKLTGQVVSKLKADLASGDITQDEYMSGMGKVGSKRRFEARQAGKDVPGGFGHGFSTAMTQTPLDRFEEMEKRGAEFANALSSNLSGAFTSIVKGSKTAKEALADFSMAMLDTIFQMATDQMFKSMFNSAFGAASGTPPGSAAGGVIKKFSGGGPVTGGTPNVDSVRADLEPGEFVMRKGAVQHYGPAVMERLNLGAVPMANGGKVGGRAPASGDADAAVFKAQYLDGLSPVVKGMSYSALKRKAQSTFGRTEGFATGGIAKPRGAAMAAVIGMGLYGAANQPDAEEIRASSGAGAKRRGSQDFSETEFRRGFAAKTATRIQKLERGIDSIAANAAIFEGGDPRNPTSVREVTGLGKTHSARAYGGGGSRKTAMDDMREARMNSFDTFEKGQEEIRKVYERAKQAHKTKKKGVMIQGLMSAAMTIAMAPGPTGPAAPANPTAGAQQLPGAAPGDLTGFGALGGVMTPNGFRRMANGGALGGGMSGGDTVAAMLMPGEYVINAAATKSIGTATLNAINGGRYNPRRARGYAQGGYVAPDTGGTPAAQMGNLGGSEETIMQLKDLVTATTSVREAIEALGQVMTQPTMQGQALETGAVGAASAGQTNNISISVNVEGGENRKQSGSSAEGGGGDDTDKKENLQEMEGFAELLETSIMKVIMEQKRPGGLLYNPNNRSGF